MIYFDTSFLIPLVMPEATSERVSGAMAGFQTGDRATSHWTRIEFMSYLGRLVRMKILDGPSAALAAERFESMLRMSFAILAPAIGDFELARQYLAHADTGLRAGDAFHLAISVNRRCTPFVTLDRTLLKAAEALGIAATSAIED